MAYLLTQVSKKESLGTDSQSATIEYLCTHHSQRFSAAVDLLGGIYVVGSPPAVVRVRPARHPEFLTLWANTVDITADAGSWTPGNSPGGLQPIGLSATEIIVNSGPARLSVVYKNLEKGDGYPDDKDKPNDQHQEIEVSTESWDFSLQNLKLPNKFFRLKNSSPATLQSIQDLQATLAIPRIEYSLARHFCVNLPRRTISDMLGRINRNAFTVHGYSWPPKTVLFLGANIRRRWAINALPYFDITYKFAIFPLIDIILLSPDIRKPGGSFLETSLTAVKTRREHVTWNRVYVPDAGYWDEAVVKCRAVNDVLGDQTERGIYLYDEPKVGEDGAPLPDKNDLVWTGSPAAPGFPAVPASPVPEVAGFERLFHPKAD